MLPCANLAHVPSLRDHSPVVSVVQYLTKVVFYIFSVFLVVYGEKAIYLQKKQRSSRGRTLKGRTLKLPIQLLLTFDCQNLVIRQCLVIMMAG